MGKPSFDFLRKFSMGDRRKTSTDVEGALAVKKTTKQKKGCKKVEGARAVNKATKQKQKKRSEKKQMENMIKSLKETNETLIKLLKANSGWTEMLFTWRIKRPDMISEAYNQTHAITGDDFGNCWAVAISRGHFALLKRDGSSRLPVTLQMVLDGVERRHQITSDGDRGLDSLKSANPFMVGGGHVNDFIIHQRPNRDDQLKNEEFEMLIESLLAKVPVVVQFDVFPSYSDFKGNGIYCPTDIDLKSCTYEKYPKHVVLLTGHGVEVHGSERIKFWEAHESYGDKWANMGFVRLARHKCLIRQVVEMKV